LEGGHIKPVNILLIILVIQNLLFIIGGVLLINKLNSLNIPEINIPEIPLNRLNELINWADDNNILNKTNALMDNMNDYYNCEAIK
jgi:hypothetical protein